MLERIKDMMKMAEEIAKMAEREADNYGGIPGDQALRMFADAIRKTNTAAADFPSPIN